jgi:glycosyltransferase involved in cell wall biosynthesis
MAEPLTSIVVPSYNRAYCLPRTVDSALAQTNARVEVIIVDDGSKDDTPALVASRYGSDPRVRFIRQDNAGVAIARNTGMRAAQGDFIALLDSDDIWEPWKLELQLACMRARPEVGMTWTDMEAIDPDGKVINPAYLRRMYSAYRWYPTSDSLFRESQPLTEVAPGLASVVGDRRFSVGDLSSAMIMGNLVHTSTVVFTRSRYEQAGAFSDQYRHAGEDYEFHLRTCRAGIVGFVDIASIKYQCGLADRITRNENDVHFARGFLRTISPIIKEQRHTIDLPPRMINAVLAEAHGWIGETSLAVNDRRQAMKHLAWSLRYEPAQPRLLGLLAAAALPTTVRGQVGNAYRALKSRALGRPASPN